MKLVGLEVGAEINGTLVLSNATIRQTKTGKDFLSFVFTDGSESIAGNFWNYTKKNLPVTNVVYDVIGNIGEYMGKKQLNIATFTVSDNQDMTEFSCVYCNNPSEVLNSIYCYMDRISNPALRCIVQRMYAIIGIPCLERASSAKSVHHVGIGGNVVHTLEVIEYAEALAAPNIPYINLDLCIAGAIIHDIGKPWVYYIDGALVDKTIEGVLTDHISIGVKILHQAVEEIHRESGVYYGDLELLLEHILLSHHGELEHGSLVTPLFMEAYIVHYADKVSATFDLIKTANTNAQVDKVTTDKIYFCGNAEHLKQATVNKWISESLS